MNKKFSDKKEEDADQGEVGFTPREVTSQYVPQKKKVPSSKNQKKKPSNKK